MATKRKYVVCDDDDDDIQEMHISNKKHTLDSDEEDSDEYEKEDLHDSDVEAEEDGISNIQDDVKITPFNMREELQEGHFDTEGHYHWNKGNDIKDNWLDNIDWIKVKTDKNYLKGEIDKEDDTTEALPAAFNEIKLYTELLTYMQKNETISQTMQRFGKGRKKLSSVDRIKQRKLGIVDEASEKITKITELANEILTNTGNMDIYQMTYGEIQKKIAADSTTSNQTNTRNTEIDMYADDFNEKEKKQLHEQTVESTSNEVFWEFKWKQDDDVLNGPFTTQQMLQWSKDGYFKTGVYCRKVNETTNFYSSSRIDFDLYL